MTSAGSLRPSLAYSFSSIPNLGMYVCYYVQAYRWFPHPQVRKKRTEELQIRFFSSSFLCIERRCIRNIKSFLQVGIPGSAAAHPPEKSLKTLTIKTNQRLHYILTFFFFFFFSNLVQMAPFLRILLSFFFNFGAKKRDFAICKTAAGVRFTFTAGKSLSLDLKHANISFN